MLHELAHEAAGGRWVATGGGGYQWARVVPARVDDLLRRDGRAPSSPDELPEGWIERAEFLLRGRGARHDVRARRTAGPRRRRGRR